MWCWNIYLTRKCYCRLSVFGVLSLWFIIICRSGWKLQANHESRAGGAWGSEHPEITESVFHTAPHACSFWSLFTTQALFQRKQSSWRDVIVQPVCCSKIPNFLGRVKVRAKHPRGALSTPRSTESQNSPLLLQTLQVPEGIHTCSILQSFFGLSPIFIFMETLPILPSMGCSASWWDFWDKSVKFFMPRRRCSLLPYKIQQVSVSSEVM